MPNQKTKESFGSLRAAPVREGETWKQYIERLRNAPAFGASEIAGLMCATVLMGKNPDAPARDRMLDALSVFSKTNNNYHEGIYYSEA